MGTWTEAQLDALRRLDPEDEHAPITDHFTGEVVRIHHKTVASLAKRGLVEKSDNAAGAVITEYGLTVIRRYVDRTGNGPERLKAMFRF